MSELPELYRWVGSTQQGGARVLQRGPHVKLRVAQLTDPHMPSDIGLMRRLRDLMKVHGSASGLSLELSGISNELGQPYRTRRKLYTNLLKKALLGLHRLQVDHLVLTGDLAHCGLAAEFLEVKAALSVMGWWGEERLTVIPGNHDRFNLYEQLPSHEPMEAFFDVVGARTPRVKRLPGGVALFEVDSNADRADDRHYMERWLPNTVGKIYPEALERLEASRGEVAGHRLIVLLHHHVSMDWYARKASRDVGGLMRPAEGVDGLLEVARRVDPDAVLAHGHIHDIMAPGYRHQGHLVSNPGGFAEGLRVNLIDVDRHDEVTITQAELISF